MNDIKYYITESIDSQEEIVKRFKEELEDSSYPEFVEKLNDMCRDSKTLNLIKMVFGGEYSNIKMDKNSRPKAAKALQPTQNEIDAEKSLKRGCTDVSTIDQCFSEPVAIKGQPIITFNRNFIVDGHHRWSQIAAFNPAAKCRVINFDNDDMGPIEMLKASQGTIAADTNRIQMSHVSGDNLLEISQTRAKELIETWLTPEAVERFCYYVKNLNNREDVIKYLLKNIKRFQINNQPVKHAPDRGFMPQTDTDPEFTENIVNTTKIEGNK